MKFRKSIDEKFAEIGFAKVYEDEFCVTYEQETKFGYTRCIELEHKSSGRHLIQSFQKGVNSDGFNNSVGLTANESRLCLKKMRQMGWREGRP